MRSSVFLLILALLVGRAKALLAPRVSLIVTRQKRWMVLSNEQQKRQEQQQQEQEQPSKQQQSPFLFPFVGSKIVDVARFDDFLESNGWVFTYADCETNEKSFEGIAFLLTNVPFFVAAYVASQAGQNALAIAVDIAGVASVAYHYAQLHFGPNRIEPRRYLFVDYFFAFNSIACVLFELWQMTMKFSSSPQVTLLPIGCGTAAVLFLFASWQYEQGRKYMTFHGTWHLLSAFTVALLH